MFGSKMKRKIVFICYFLFNSVVGGNYSLFHISNVDKVSLDAIGKHEIVPQMVSFYMHMLNAGENTKIERLFTVDIEPSGVFNGNNKKKFIAILIEFFNEKIFDFQIPNDNENNVTFNKFKNELLRNSFRINLDQELCLNGVFEHFKIFFQSRQHNTTTVKNTKSKSYDVFLYKLSLFLTDVILFSDLDFCKSVLDAFKKYQEYCNLKLTVYIMNCNRKDSSTSKELKIFLNYQLYFYNLHFMSVAIIQDLIKKCIDFYLMKKKCMTILISIDVDNLIFSDFYEAQKYLHYCINNLDVKMKPITARETLNQMYSLIENRTQSFEKDVDIKNTIDFLRLNYGEDIKIYFNIFSSFSLLSKIMNYFVYCRIDFTELYLPNEFDFIYTKQSRLVDVLETITNKYLSNQESAIFKKETKKSILKQKKVNPIKVKEKKIVENGLYDNQFFQNILENAVLIKNKPFNDITIDFNFELSTNSTNINNEKNDLSAKKEMSTISNEEQNGI
ncbi:hypothetical protein EDEG_03570 [Edhazardia aedis USNM 41457]|uniref:Uncharacterized protein n=1 Tax=Edhazardia aedis (strain USNM 41457) TaxID=1003232 RepID=J9DKP2_EDHAE|nr:hypothetical protein EDEG_03570 [Edhazardia aedis USNM 41457]|eukprot:EJW01962.1 hypothetical protein EDEG_03570 [Edhazardia aedis USNM 41457]